MPRTFGQPNPSLTKAIRRVARITINIRFSTHAREEMENDDFDDADVLMCLRKGTAYGPEERQGELRANVIHGGTRIRVVVGSIAHAADDWSALERLAVVTVMKDE